MTDWQPIDTAPKDGRLILSARFNEGVIKWAREACWVSSEDMADMNGGDPEEYDPAWASLGDEDDPIYPTHWVAMPDPPSTSPASTTQAQPG